MPSSPNHRQDLTGPAGRPRVFHVVIAYDVTGMPEILTVLIRDRALAGIEASVCQVADRSVEALLDEHTLPSAGLVLLLMNNLGYPDHVPPFPDPTRYLWALREIRWRTSGYIFAFCSNWLDEEVMRTAIEAGADAVVEPTEGLRDLSHHTRAAYRHWQRDCLGRMVD